MFSLSVLFEDNQPSRQINNIGPGQTLLEVLLLNSIAIRHDCGGICHCTTCHIYAEKGAELIAEASRRESDFLKKVKSRKPTSRLACQCLLMEEGGELAITIPIQEKQNGRR